MNLIEDAANIQGGLDYLTRLVVDMLSLLHTTEAQDFFQHDEYGQALGPFYEKMGQVCRCAAFLFEIPTAVAVSHSDLDYFMQYSGSDPSVKVLRPSHDDHLTR